MAKISLLPALNDPNGTELVPVVKDGKTMRASVAGLVSGAVAGTVDNLKVDAVAYIGRPGDAGLIDGTPTGIGAVYWHDTVDDAGSLFAVDVFDRAAGTINLAVYRGPRNALVRVALASFNTTGTRTSRRIALAEPIAVRAGDFLAVQPTAGALVVAEVQSGDVGYTYSAPYLPEAIALDAPTTNGQVQVRFVIAYRKQVVTADTFLASTAVKIVAPRAVVLSSDTNPRGYVEWKTTGQPTAHSVRWGNYSVTLDGQAQRMEFPNFALTQPYAFIGNSLTDSTDVIDRWSQVLAARYGQLMISAARYSSDWRMVYRVGAKAIVLTLGGALPANGSVAVSKINGAAIDGNNPAAFLTTGDASVVSGMAMSGYLTRNGVTRRATVSAPNGASYVYSVTQAPGQTAITFDGPVTFVPDFALSVPGRICLIWLGNNYFFSGVANAYGDYTNPQMWVDLKLIVAFLQARGCRVMLLPVIPSSGTAANDNWVARGPGTPYTAMESANARTEAMFPGLMARHADGRTLLKFLQDRNDGSPEALDDVAKGFTPRNLRRKPDGSYDLLHMYGDGAGDRAIADFVDSALQAQVLPNAITQTTDFVITAIGAADQVPDVAIVRVSRDAVAGLAERIATTTLGVGERLRDVQPGVTATGGAQPITKAGVLSGFSIAANQTGISSFLRPALPIPAEIAARFAGTTIRLKVAFAATANFLIEKPIGDLPNQLGQATFIDGTGSSAGFTSQVLTQVGGFIFREVSYTLTGGESHLAILAQINGFAVTGNAHSLELASLTWSVDAVPAGARFSGADVVATWRSYEQRTGIGPIFNDAQGLSVGQSNGGTNLTVGARVLGISTALGATGQGSAAGIVIPVDPMVSPAFAGKTCRIRFSILTSGAFTRTFDGKLRTRYGVQFAGTIAGTVLTLTSPAVNAVTGAPATIQGGLIYINGINGTVLVNLTGLASGVNGAVGSTYTLQYAQTGYTVPTVFTQFAYRFPSCAVETDVKLSSTRRLLTMVALPNQPFVGDELFIEPYLAQLSTTATTGIETWQIDDAALSINTVPVGFVGGPAEAMQNVASLRATVAARALAATDAQAIYPFGIGDVLALCSISDQANTNRGGATIAGNTATIPSGSTGKDLIFQRSWTFDGAANANKIVKLRIGFVPGATFTRSMACTLQVRTAAGTSARAAVIVAKTSGTSIVYQIDYAVQGDEIALAPFVICNSTTATTAAETLTFVSFLPQFATTTTPGRSVADENIAQLIAGILAQAATLIAAGGGSYAVTKTVKPIGGDFAHPKLALDAITDATAAKRYCLLIYPGTYEGYAEWNTKDYVDMIGVGRREEVIIKYELPNDAAAATIIGTSTFWWNTITNLKNLTVTARNMRYAVHQETNGNRPGITQTAENCVFIHYGNDAAVNSNAWAPGSQAAVGTGSSDGMTAIHKACRFVGPGVTGYHQPNAGSRSKPIKFRWEGCEMVVTRAGAVVTNQPALVASVLQQGVGDTFELVGCSVGGEFHYIASTWQNAADTTTSRAQIAINAYGNTPFTFVNKITGAPGGDYAPMLTGR